MCKNNFDFCGAVNSQKLQVDCRLVPVEKLDKKYLNKIFFVQSTLDIRDADIRNFCLQGAISNGPNDFQCKIILKYLLIRDLDVRDFCL